MNTNRIEILDPEANVLAIRNTKVEYTHAVIVKTLASNGQWEIRSEHKTLAAAEKMASAYWSRNGGGTKNMKYILNFYVDVQVTPVRKVGA